MKKDIRELHKYPDPDIDAQAIIRQYVRDDDHVFIVLDDDPTGTQCVHDIKVCTDWSYETLKKAMESEKLFFILTNSRGLSVKETEKLHNELCENVSRVYRETGKKYLYLSRSDSTLRGHYPLECDILSKWLEKDFGKVDGQILFPYFKEGGRYTIDDVHYVRYGNDLIPCAETEFAKDETFGYSHSDLKEYIEEKTSGAYKKEDVVSFSLEELRKADIASLSEKLLSAKQSARIIVNAVDDIDARIFSIAVYEALKKGKIYCFRTAASFVKCLGGISDRTLLKRKDMIREENENGGLIVVGSHTDKTNRQLNELLKVEGTKDVAFRSSLVNEGSDQLEAEITRCIALSEKLITEGKTPVIYTERVLIPTSDKEEALRKSVAISDALMRIVSSIGTRPSYVIAKGGITSADVAVKGLKIKEALVLGQIEPGVPVWSLEADSRFPGVPYIIFPGNVGDDDTLKNAVLILKGEK